MKMGLRKFFIRRHQKSPAIKPLWRQRWFQILGVAAGALVAMIIWEGSRPIILWSYEYVRRPKLVGDCQSWSLKTEGSNLYATYTLVEIQNEGFLSRPAKKIRIKVHTSSPIQKLCFEPGSRCEIAAGGEGEEFVDIKLTQEIARGRSYFLGIWNKTNDEYSFGKVPAAHVPLLDLLDEGNQK